MNPSRRSRIFILLGLTLVATSGLLTLARDSARPPAADADVFLVIEDPAGRLLIEAPVMAPASNATVLGVLLQAGQEHAFQVEVQDFMGLGAMVVAIQEFRNEGACGWVYEVDGVGGDRSAALRAVTDGETIHWFWNCHWA